MSIIEEFLEHYEREYDYYCKLASITHEFCQEWMNKNAIRGIVTSRGKSIQSLREKIYFRAASKDYRSMDDIYKDIVDLAGVRVALYFPSNFRDIDIILRRHLTLDRVLEFPIPNRDKIKRFRNDFERKNRGYVATHYRGYLNHNLLKSDQHRFKNSRVEIQVATVLMHAWSEVEHDLVYKSRSGNLSLDELTILDEINGIVAEGEKALLKLWQAGDHRLSQPANIIKNKYELSALLHQYLDRFSEAGFWDINLGEVESLMEFLTAAGFDTTEKLENCFRILPDDGQGSLCQALSDAVIQLNPEAKEYLGLFT